MQFLVYIYKDKQKQKQKATFKNITNSRVT